MPPSNPTENILVTKLEVPLVSFRIVPRLRLTDKLRMGMEKRLTLLVAPTGYGKTTLLVESLSRIIKPDWRIIWLSVDSYDNQPLRIWTYIATGLKKIYPSLRFDPRRSFQSQGGTSSSESLTPLINAISQTPYHLVLILDDYQFITYERVHDEIQFLIDHQPKNLHLLISSRVVPPFPLGRIRTQRQLVELSMRDLTFTLPEAKKFFATTMEVDIDHEQATSLLLATEGWIAGLQLASLSLIGKSDQQSFITKFPEINYQIFEYLMEEVLDKLDPDIRDFLLKTSLLSEMSAPLCDAMLDRTDSKEMLNKIQLANLFMISRDVNRVWFSYHRLFADTLQKYLHNTFSSIIPELHRKACIWLENNGYPDKAISHALAYGDLEKVAKIIDACALQAVINFDLVKLIQWLSLFSDELLIQRPRLGIFYALANFLLERFDKVEPKLITVEQILDSAHKQGRVIEEEELIRWEIEVLRANLGYWQTDSVEVLPIFNKLMKNPPKNDIYFYGFMHHSLAEVYASLGNLKAAEDAYIKGCQFAIDNNLIREYYYSQSELAFIRKLQGRLQKAKLDYQDLIYYATLNDMPDDVTAFAKTGLAEIALEQNQFDQADEQINWVIENYYGIETSPLNWNRLEWIYIRLSQYYLARKDYQNSDAFFQKAMTGFHSNPYVVHYISSQLIDLQVKIWSVRGDLNSKELNIERQLDYLDTTRNSKQARQVALIRYLLAQSNFTEALVLINDLLPEIENQGMYERLIEVLILKSLAYYQIGESKLAVQSISQSLKLAAPEGYRRFFVEEGDPIKTLIKQASWELPNENNLNINSVGNLIIQINSDFNKQEENPSSQLIINADHFVQPLLEPLTNREIEILHLLTIGKSTKEISYELKISINTTKVHIKNLFRKTDTHSRHALFRRVVDLGLIKQK